MLKLVICLAGFLAISIASTSINSHLSNADLERLHNVFIDGLASNDLQSIYYSVLNIKLENISADNKQSICKKIVDLHKDSKLNDFEKIFYFVATSNKLKCPGKIDEKIQAAITSAHTKDTATAQEIFYNYFSLKSLGPISETIQAKIASNIQAALKKDDSLASLGYGFYVAFELGTNGRQIYDWVESAFAQADEVDGKMLQFEGGLSITGLVFNGALRLTSALNKPSIITDEQLVKFVNYFLSRRSVQIAKGASILLEALQTITQQKGAPICIQLFGNRQILIDAPSLHIKVVDVLGKPVTPSPASVTGNVIAKPGNTGLVSKGKFVSKSSDKTVYSLDLLPSNPSPGAYVADIFVDTYKQTLSFNVLGKVKVQSFEIGVGEIDSTSTVKKSNLVYPNKLANDLSADFQQKVVFKAMLVDEKTGSPLTVHQAFVRLENKQSKEEIIFVAEQDTSKAYKFDMDIGARGGEFGFKSGSYVLEFLVGDASLSNSFRWHICDINLKFSSDPKVASGTTDKPTKMRPEIVHQFREPEKTPPQIVSTFFTVLCGVPLLILFYLWAKLRVNVLNFSFSLVSLGFHIGFGAILSLFGLFFLKFNMFETIRYLIPLALFTFFCGNRLLRTIAANRSSDLK